MVFRHKPKPQPQEIDKSLIELWRAENEVRKLEGLPPVSWEVWLSWYKWRKKQAEQGGVI
jgi:hypothetical protein